MSLEARSRPARKVDAEVARLREDFPALAQKIGGKPLAYLDSAASAQCPRSVLDAIFEQQGMNHANVHRGVHYLAERATAAYEAARDKVAAFVNASSREEIVFTRGTTESINLVAASLGGSLLKAGDEILVSGMEHHSNIVPWQLIAARTGARLVPVPITPAGELDLEAFERALCDKTRIVALTHVSNALGTVNPVRALTEKAQAAGALVVLDGAQAVPHFPVDVRDIGCDFYAFSGHKMFAGTGIGALYGRAALLDRMPPYQGGGEMILTVAFDSSTYNVLPYKFEAGTPNVTGAVALGAAIDYLSRLDREAVAAYENGLLAYATDRLLAVPALRIIGTARAKVGVASFVIDGIHAHDLGTIVNDESVAIRTGHHCAMPVMDFFGVAATARASLALYNNEEDVDRLILGLERARKLFK
ncbi:MAG TPA: cysteine desulfurase [Gammaproteobacteria bacterium]|nr:cysteine desulfurase [Gammaproteobacteria bacterium]